MTEALQVIFTKEFIPTPSLQRFVRSFLYMKCASDDDFPYTGLLVPDGYPEIYIFEGAGMRTTIAGRPDTISEPYLSGQLGTSVRCVPTGAFRSWSIKLRPWAMSLFTRVPMNELFDRNVELSQLFTKANIERLKQVWSQPDLPSAARFLERVVFETVHGSIAEQGAISAGRQHVERAVDTIVEQGGWMQVGAYCSANDISRQYLERQFQRHVGLAPVTYARILRVRRIVNRMKESSNWNFTDLAYCYGYADQSHFNRDFKRITGLPPGRFNQERHFVITS